jgi:hypothetical protein
VTSFYEQASQLYGGMPWNFHEQVRILGRGVELLSSQGECERVPLFQ